MGTYISHFRNVESLLPELYDPDVEAFLFGNLAPDSGIPNSDWSQFNPPRNVTHFLSPNKSEEQIEDMVFYRQYLIGVDKETDTHKYSFLLGYFIHLVCDNLWNGWVVAASRKHYATTIQQMGPGAWQLIRNDWHDLDRKFYKEHSDHQIWEIMRHLSNPPMYLAYLPSEAMRQQMAYIKNIYLQPNESGYLSRKYLYLNEATMDRFVYESTDAVLEILEQREKLMQSSIQTALSLLQPEKLRPYAYPLGDTQ